ncbi:hypothetical protein MASR2M18_01270 [Ignavibacteria bacterium]|jgi:hypothetical protein|nr:hypothetical protein [Bacteroidota bacterium]MCZ2132605.1 hypothetical protein [Bacteroidota bacterium]
MKLRNSNSNMSAGNLPQRYDIYNENGYLCELCLHLQGRVRKQCVAFPAGIPAEIWNGEIDHRHSYVGDGGLTFEPKNNTAAQRAVRR